MIQVTYNFLEALKDREGVVVFAYVGSNMGRRVFGKIHPVDQWTGSTGGIIQYNGVASVGDGSLFGSENIIINADEIVLSFGSLRETLVPDGNDLLASLKETEKTGSTLILNNTNFYFSDILADESFITQEILYKLGFPSLSHDDFIQIYSGEIISETAGETCSLSSKAGTLQDLEIIYYPGRSSRYANPESQDEVLPDVYGDCTKNSTGGPIKAVCIDTVNHYYLFANHAILSVANGNTITVYKDGVVISSGFSIVTSGTDENGDTIAYLNFTSAPSGVITVSCMGMDDGDGSLLENPVDILEAMLDRMNVTDIQNSQAFAQARQTAESEDYKAAGVVIQEKNRSFWVKHLLNSFLGDFWHNANDEIVISLDTISRNSIQISAFLDESDLDYSEEPERLRENICNQAVIRYAPFFSSLDRRYSEGASESWGKIDDGNSSKDVASQTQYGIQERAFDLWWVRDDTVVSTIQSNIIAEFKDNIWIFPVAENSFKHCYLEKGDYIVSGCRYLRDEDGNELINQVWRILEINRDLDNFKQTYRLIDTGDYYPEPPIYYNGTTNIGDYSGRGRSTQRLVD